MNDTSKKPLFCLKWPWDNNNTPQNPNSCSSSNPPFLFKSLQTLTSLTSSLINPNPNTLKLKTQKGFTADDDQAELEQRALACALSNGKDATLLHYDIKYVPCFILLDKDGNALAKTGVPHNRLHVVAGVSHLLKLKRSPKK
ncbi:hypothetical protein Tco_0458203 [Tanacetum coccineum]